MILSLQQERARCALALEWLAGMHLSVPSTRPEVHGAFILRASAHPQPDAFVVKEVFRPAFANLTRMSGGCIEVQEAWGETAHPANQGFEALADGRTDFAPCYTSWEAERFPLAQLLALPGLFPSTELATAVSEELYPEYLRQEFERPGVAMGRLKATGPYHLFSRKPMSRLSDLAGALVATNAGIDSRVAAALGAQPVPLRSDQLLAAFRSGQVDAVSLADGSADVFGVGSLAACRVSMGMAMMNLEFGLSQSFWTGLPAPLQSTLNDWLRAQAQAEAQVFYGVGGVLARERFQRAGCRFVDLPDADRAELQQRMARLTDDVAAELDARFLPGSRFVSRARELSARYAQWSADDFMHDALHKPRWLMPGERII